MNEREAVEYMENEIRCIQRAVYCDRDCSKCDLVKEDEPLLEAFGMAIKALEKQIPKTNADRIRAMNDEELAEFFNKFDNICGMCSENIGCISTNTDVCKNGILQWLQSEAE